MLTAGRFLDILEQKDLLDVQLVEKLRAQVTAAKAPIAPETIAQRLVEKKYLTFAVAERVLKQAREPAIDPAPSPATSSAASASAAPPLQPDVGPRNAESEPEAEGASTSGGRLHSLVSTPGRSAITAAVAVFVILTGGGLLLLLIGVGIYFGTKKEETPAPSIQIEVSDKQPTPVEPEVLEPEPEPGLTLNPREAEALRLLDELRNIEQPSQEDIDAALGSDDPFALLDLHIGTMEAMGGAINPEGAPQAPQGQRPTRPPNSSQNRPPNSPRPSTRPPSQAPPRTVPR